MMTPLSCERRLVLPDVLLLLWRSSLCRTCGCCCCGCCCCWLGASTCVVMMRSYGLWWCRWCAFAAATELHCRWFPITDEGGSGGGGGGGGGGAGGPAEAVAATVTAETATGGAPESPQRIMSDERNLFWCDGATPAPACLLLCWSDDVIMMLCGDALLPEWWWCWWWC